MSRAYNAGYFRAPPVRRGSELAINSRWKRFSREEGHRLLFVLKVRAERLRKPGQRTGAPGTISFGAIRLAEVLVSLCVKGRGRLEPSVAWLAKAINVAKKSIHAWKQQLQEHGFLRWTRRYVRVQTPGQKGPQLKQTSNSYSLLTPAAAAAQAEQLRPSQLRTSQRILSPELHAALAKLEHAVGDEKSPGAQCELPVSAQPKLTNLY
ncbi:hypothetical protein [Brevundimonas sp.]|jgi:hypothetical protein|uniref:hypothetical protein n=1 Tax=Brevundimonas sp. TaxID=1871086 RepID=UPI002ED8815B